MQTTSEIKLNGALLLVRAAKTARELERIWLVSYPHFERNSRLRKCFAEAVEAKGWDLVDASPLGSRIPRIAIKYARAVAILNGETYKTGQWGNGPGYRYAMHYLREWVKAKGRFRSQRRCDIVIDAVLWQWPHRALLALAH